MGKQSEKEWVYIYIKLNHCAAHLKRTHCKSTLSPYKVKINLQNKDAHMANKILKKIIKIIGH